MSLRSSLSQPWPGPAREALLPDTVRGGGGVGLFQEKPHSLQNNIRTSLEKKKRGSGVSWAGRPEAALQGQWGVCTGWVGQWEVLVQGCRGPVGRAH